MILLDTHALVWLDAGDREILDKAADDLAAHLGLKFFESTSSVVGCHPVVEGVVGARLSSNSFEQPACIETPHHAIEVVATAHRPTGLRPILSPSRAAGGLLLWITP